MQGFLDQVVMLDLKVLQEQPVFLDQKDQTVQVELLDQQELRVVMGLGEILVSPDQWDNLVLSDNLGH